MKKLSHYIDPDGTALVDMWISIGATPTKKIKVGWDKEFLDI
jgi:hypothetical protein